MGGLSHRGGGKQSWPAGGGGGGSAVPSGPAGGSLWSTYPNPGVKEVRSNGATAPIYVGATTLSDGTLIGTFGATGLVMAAAMALTLGAAGTLVLPSSTAASGDIRAGVDRALLVAGANEMLATSGGGATQTFGGGNATTVLNSATTVSISTASTTRMSFTSSVATLAVPLVLPGGAPPASGDIRGTINRVLLSFLNSAAADSALISTDASNNGFFGVNSAGTSGCVTAVLGGTAGATIRQGATTLLLANTTNIVASSPLVMNTGTYIALPGTVATVGGVRGANDVLLLAGRNTTSGTIGIVHVDTGNGFVLGSTKDGASLPTQISFNALSAGFTFRPSGTNIRFYVAETISLVSPALVIGTYGGTQPSIGNLRVEKNTTILVALTAADANMALIATDASSGAYFGSTAAGASQVVTSRLNGSTSTILQSNATDRVTVTTSTVTTTLPIVLPGAAPATTGDLRASKNRVVMACLHTDTTTNLPIVEVTNADGLILGDGSWATVAIEGPSGKTLTIDATRATLTADLKMDKPGFYNTNPVAQQTIVGSWAGGAAAILQDLLTKIALTGLWVDGTTP